jgi:hypothetical protein
MPFAAVSSVERLGVNTQEPVHSGRDQPRRCLDQQMDVRAHQAPGVDAEPEPSLDDAQQAQKRRPVLIVEKDPDAAGALRRHMPDTGREAFASDAGHLRRR